MINIGAKIAYLRWQEKCNGDENKLCVVSHDIDMLPLNSELKVAFSQKQYIY